MINYEEFKELLEVLEEDGEAEVEISVDGGKSVITGIEQNTGALKDKEGNEQNSYNITGYGRWFNEKEYRTINKAKLRNIICRE